MFTSVSLAKAKHVVKSGVNELERLPYLLGEGVCMREGETAAIFVIFRERVFMATYIKLYAGCFTRYSFNPHNDF